MITKLEHCAKDSLHVEGAPNDGLRMRDAASKPARIRVGWDITLGLTALAYLVLVLFDDVESPLLSLLLVFLVAYALIRPYMREG